MIVKKKQLLFYWLIFLLASFAYEKPVLILSSIDRLNPRLFDIVSILGIFLLPFTKKIEVKNLIFEKYKQLIIWFGICSFLSLIIYSFPSEIDIYIIYYYISYLQELFVLFIAVRVIAEINSLETIFKVFLWSGIFVFGYSYYEYFYGVAGELEFAPGKFVMKPEGVIWGPFGNTYFQIATYLPLVFILIFGYASTLKGIKSKLIYGISAITAWPLLYTGSRTGLALLIISLLVFMFFRFKGYYAGIVILLISVLILFSLKGGEFETINRLENMENNKSNSISSRITIFEEFELGSYVEDGILLPFFGGGFYVAPTNGNYRIGYGFHNIYIFAFEQSGVFGLILFISFLASASKYLFKGLISFSSRKGSLEYVFLAATLSYLISEIIVGLAGHSFWRGFATNNFNTLRILILILATSLIFSKKHSLIEVENSAKA